VNLAHIHLLLNHFPTVGMIIGLGLLLLALISKSDDLKRTSLVVFLGIALLTLPTFMTGSAAGIMQNATEAATQAICIVAPKPDNAPCKDTNISRPLIEAHRDLAMLGLLFMEFLGAVAWLGLWQYRRNGRVSSANLTAVLILAVITFGVMADAANMAGGIRHPEVLSEQEAASIAAAKAAAPNSTALSIGTRVGRFVVGAPWMWPVCETLHFIGLSLLLGVVFFVDLRMMGFMKNVSFATLHRILPWAVLGFGINVITGMFFFIGAPEQYTTNTSFQWKILLVLVAGLNALYFTVLDQPWTLGSGEEAPGTAKVFAMSAMFLWVAIMFFGSMLPFLGNAF
jgi:hypothetical protein